MFKGLSGEQFHQFISSRTSSIPQLPLSFPNTSFPSFDPYTNSSHHQQVPFQTNNFLHPLNQFSPPTINKSYAENVEIIQRERLQELEPEDPWSSDEVVALLRIRSSFENWFHEFTWEQVSRKLADHGFKRSAEKCKEKYEEESRYFNNINSNISHNKNYHYRAFGELEELYNSQDENPHQEEAPENSEKMEKPRREEERQEEEEEEKDKVSQEESRNDQPKAKEDNGRNVAQKSKGKKRKRSSEESFEIFKGFCEGIVQKILTQQAEMHVKLIEDMVRRDEEKAAREEQWKKEEMDRINKELELRAQEQALACDRQAIIIKFLKNFTSPSGSNSLEVLGDGRSQDPTSSPSSVPSPLVLRHNPNAPSQDNNNPSRVLEDLQMSHQKSSSSPKKIRKPNEPSTPLEENQSPQNPTSLEHPNPSSLNTQDDPLAPSPLPTYKTKKMSTPNKEDLGKRWPRDEVFALINIRSSLFSEDKEVGARAPPLWERISQGMLELGYKRSAKRCKEKWENINKYFRKTKDLNKKRSVDSRTCPYFHQLNALYNQRTNSCLESP